MLPFLKKREASASANPDPTLVRRVQDETEVSAPLEIVMKELFQAQTDKERALAFKAAFEILEMKPHNEASHG